MGTWRTEMRNVEITIMHRTKMTMLHILQLWNSTQHYYTSIIQEGNIFIMSQL